MPQISCFVNERTMRILERESAVRGMSVEELAERSIESCAISTLPGGFPVPGFDGQYFDRQSTQPHFGRIDLGGCEIGYEERRDGSFRITS